jgi:hypothetical protein
MKKPIAKYTVIDTGALVFYSDDRNAALEKASELVRDGRKIIEVYDTSPPKGVLERIFFSLPN